MSTQTEMQNQEKKNNNKIWYSIIALLVILVGVVGYLYLSTNTAKKELEAEKEAQRVMFTQELDSLMTEHEAVKVEYSELTDSLFVKDSMIQQNAKEIKNLLNYKWDYYKVNKKLKKLRKISQGYLVQIDSLYRVNEVLKGENLQLKQDVQMAQRKNTELRRHSEQLEQKVEDAAILKAYNIEAEGYKISGSRERATDKARRIDKIEVCFTIGQNMLVDSGKKNIYMRIAQPDNKVLTKAESDSYSFEFEGNILQYSMMKVLDYTQEATDICGNWYVRDDEKLQAGRYVISVYTDTEEIGQTFLDLR